MWSVNFSRIFPRFFAFSTTAADQPTSNRLRVPPVRSCLIAASGISSPGGDSSQHRCLYHTKSTTKCGPTFEKGPKMPTLVRRLKPLSERLGMMLKLSDSVVVGVGNLILDQSFAKLTRSSLMLIQKWKDVLF